MAKEDPWAAFDPAPPPGSAQDGQDPWAAFAPLSNENEPVPEAFLDRVRLGQAVSRIAQKTAAGAREGYGESTPTGFSNETLNQLIDAGVFHDPAKGRPGPIQFANETFLLPTAKAFDVAMRGLQGGIHGLGGFLGQLHDELGLSIPGTRGTGESLRREVINGANWALVEAGFGRFSRPAVSSGQIIDHEVGGLPKPVDFRTAAEVVAPDAVPTAEANLRRKWQEDGVHPAEAVNDARRDAFLRQEITRADPDPAVKLPPEAWSPEALAEKPYNLPAEAPSGPARSLGAAATEDMPSLAQQPPPPPGSLLATLKSAGDAITDATRDLQMLATPMAAGTRDSMAIAKDFANTMRRNRWEWERIDQEVAKRFTPEQRTRMWNAADEESVARQLGESREHQGLITLEPAERAMVEDLQARAQSAWLRARDMGMVEGEGLPAYTPRMVINVAAAGSAEGAIPLNGIGLNLRTRTSQMLQRKYMTAEETEAAAKKALGEEAVLARDIRALPLATARLEDAIAGRTLIDNIKETGKRSGSETVVEGGIPAGGTDKWFTLDHPAFRTWREVRKDANGDAVFEQVPIYVRSDFEGPLRAVLTQRSGPIYGALMDLKGKTMSVIMNSPLIHNAVEWGRALPAMPGKVATFKVYFEGNRAKQNVALMHEAIDAGLVPIGKRFFNQDITGIMEAPNLTPGRSWTSQVLAFLPGLFDEAAGVAVKRAIDKAGDFWHNTLLWDRIGDLQMGLYVNFRDSLAAKGVDATTANRAAAHWANRYAGALPQEAMSDGARKIANMMLFSRSFTLGNVGVIKDMLTGLPKDVIAQIERDAGFRAGSISEAGKLVGPEAEAVQFSKTMARRKAIAIVLADVVLMYVGNSILQSAINVLRTDRTLDEEMRGYAERFSAALDERKEHPLKLLQVMDFLEQVSATGENEPGKRDRIRIGTAKDGTAIYARNPAGKIGEEFIGYMTGPLDMLRRKLGTVARPGWQILANDAGFGRKVYDPQADTPEKYMKNIGLIAAHLAKSQFPEGQISAGVDLVKGEGDQKVAALQTFGPIAGVTFAKGAPGGPAIGELYHARQMHTYQVDAALPDLRRQIQRGDISGAMDRMTQLGIPPGLQKFYIRTSLFPETRLGGRTLRDFYLYATPEQRDRMERSRE